MKRILIVNTGFTYNKVSHGGVSKMLLWLGNSIDVSRYNVSFCNIHDTKRSDKISQLVNSIELAIPSYGSSLKRHTLGQLKTCFALNKIFKQNHYDYVINFDGIVFFVLLLLKIKYRFTFIVSERADPNYNHSIITKVKRWLYRCTNVVVCQTNNASKCFPQTIQRKCVVIPNPVEIPENQWGKTFTKKIIVTAGRLNIWQKRQDILIKAFALVCKKHQDYMLNILGEGDDLPKLTELVNSLGISANVIFAGHVSNVQHVLLKSSFFVLTSDFEGIPNALLEAMALGMPVISTKCSPGGAELLINDNVNGLLVDCGDTITLYKKMCFFIENPDIAKEMGGKARNSMYNYETKKIIDLWHSIMA